jgi:hypothetical protein
VLEWLERVGQPFPRFKPEQRNKRCGTGTLAIFKPEHNRNVNLECFGLKMEETATPQALFRCFGLNPLWGPKCTKSSSEVAFEHVREVRESVPLQRTVSYPDLDRYDRVALQ